MTASEPSNSFTCAELNRIMKKNVTAAIVDLKALAWNYRQLAGRITGHAKMTAVIKADGYGHGAVEVAKVALRNGASRLAVARFSEALELRDAGIEAPILLFGYILPENVVEAVSRDIILSVNSFSAAQLISALAAGKGMKAKVHIKTDTGMGRLGIVADPLSLHQGHKYEQKSAAEIRAILELEGLEVEGLYTHFASADSLDKSSALHQYELFEGLIKELHSEGIEIPILHCANSAATIELPQTHLDMVRPGVAQYGLWPSDETDQSLIDLRPVMTLASTIIHIKEVPAGFKISYGSTYETGTKQKIATLPLGYADGYSRQLSNKGSVLVNGVRCPIVGRVCMDLTMVDVTEADCMVGDRVVAIGAMGDNRISTEEIASIIDTINYEVVTSIGKRVPRIYLPAETSEQSTGGTKE